MIRFSLTHPLLKSNYTLAYSWNSRSDSSSHATAFLRPMLVGAGAGQTVGWGTSLHYAEAGAPLGGQSFQSQGYLAGTADALVLGIASTGRWEVSVQFSFPQGAGWTDQAAVARGHGVTARVTPAGDDAAPPAGELRYEGETPSAGWTHFAIVPASAAFVREANLKLANGFAYQGMGYYVTPKVVGAPRQAAYTDYGSFHDVSGPASLHLRGATAAPELKIVMLHAPAPPDAFPESLGFGNYVH